MHVALPAQHFFFKKLKATVCDKLLNIMGHLAVRQGERAVWLNVFSDFQL